MSTRSDSANDLGAFLKARRSGIGPATAGIAASGRRRVPGLRREEVAQLAMISTDYYTRLEQGRLAGASTTVLDSLATALCLVPDERTYLYQLANKSDRPPSPRRPRAEQVIPQNQVLLDNLRDSPAIVLGRYLDVLAWNRLATAVFTDFGAVPRRERNFLRLLFLDPTVRRRYVDWPSIARICVGYVRAAAEDHSDARLSELIGDLSVRDPDFRAWWAERFASYQTQGTKTLFHPQVGQYSMDWQILRTAFEQQTLLVMTVPPGGDGLEVLRRLDSSQDTPGSET